MSGGLTTSWDDGKAAGATISPTFHTYGVEVTQFEKVSSQKPGAQLELTFR
jgi:hypothetical protein